MKKTEELNDKILENMCQKYIYRRYQPKKGRRILLL